MDGPSSAPDITRLRTDLSSTSRATMAMTAIKDYILHEHLQPGDPLPTETDLCEQLGMSRSSVREAVRTLVALDIVEVRHGPGTFVGQVSMRPMVESLVFRGLLRPGDDYSSLLEVVQVRVALDTAVANDLVAVWNDSSDEQLEDLVTQMEHLAAAGRTFTEQDHLFHSMLLAPLPNQLFAHLTDAFWAVHNLTVPLLGAPAPDDIVLTANAHRHMLDTARAGDADGYRAAVVEHYAPLLRALGDP